MKRLRVWLILLLMLLLPIRGAMAAAMLCLPQDGPRHVMAQHVGGEQSGHDHIHHGHAAPVDADIEQTGHDGDQAALDSENCNLCASSCSLTPLVSTAPHLRHPWAQAALNSAPPVPVSSFVSDGEDRPPRTI